MRTRLAAPALARGALSSFRPQLLSCWTPPAFLPCLCATVVAPAAGPPPAVGSSCLDTWLARGAWKLTHAAQKPESQRGGTLCSPPPSGATNWSTKVRWAGPDVWLEFPFLSHPASRSPTQEPRAPSRGEGAAGTGCKGAPGAGRERRSPPLPLPPETGRLDDGPEDTGNQPPQGTGLNTHSFLSRWEGGRFRTAWTRMDGDPGGALGGGKGEREALRGAGEEAKELLGGQRARVVGAAGES